MASLKQDGPVTELPAVSLMQVIKAVKEALGGNGNTDYRMKTVAERSPDFAEFLSSASEQFRQGAMLVYSGLASAGKVPTVIEDTLLEVDAEMKDGGPDYAIDHLTRMQKTEKHRYLASALTQLSEEILYGGVVAHRILEAQANNNKKLN